MLDGRDRQKRTGHFKCSIDSKYIGEVAVAVDVLLCINTTHSSESCYLPRKVMDSILFKYYIFRNIICRTFSKTCFFVK